MITYLSVTILSFISYQLLRRVKIKPFRLQYLLLIPFVILLVFTANNPDYQVYRDSFEVGGGPYYEKGIKIVSDILRTLGLFDYRFFLILVAGLVLYAFACWGRSIENIGTVILPYSLFIMYYDTIQIRFTVAMMLIIIALYYSTENRTILALVFCFLSILFHRLSTLSCLIVLYLSLKKPKKNYELVNGETIVLLTCGLVGCLFAKPVVNYIVLKWPFFTRITLYMTADAGYDSLIIWVGYELFLIGAIYHLGYRSFINDPFVSTKEKEKANKLLRFMLFGIAISGFLLFIEEFNRMYRLFYLTGYLIYGIIERHIQQANRIILFSTICLASMMFMIIAAMRGINFDLYW